jgi:diguanylate cyclase (GGDEF)-like protein
VAVEAPTRGSVPGGATGVIDLTATSPASGTGAVWQASLTGLRAARELTGLGLWEWQSDSGRLLWSPEMYHFVGRAPGGPEPTLDDWHQCIHPEDLDRARRLDVLATHQETGAVESLRVIGHDGVERHLQCWSIVVAAESGRPRSVCGAVVDVTRQMNDRLLLEKLSATDAITGLDNRLAFDRRMRELLSDPTRDVALLLLDLDRFKMVNDSLGHRVGDRLLVEVARRLSEVVPEGSITARMGGDEFVIVPKPGLGWLQVRRLAQSVVDSLRTPFVLPESGEMLVCPASVGVTSTSGRQVGVTDLLREADLALYRAKDSGRDRYIVFDDVLRARAQSRHRAERQLRQALEEGRLALQYQPIVDFANGRIVGAEALVRLRDGNSDRLLGPDEFVDVAEDTGLIVEVDCWVIDTAIAQIRAWGEALTAGERGPWLAVNVSPRSMEHPQVIRRILDAVKQGRIPRHRIKVELTEHSFLGTLPGGESSLRQLLGSGIPVGIDDFGTGYSALAYLQRFELDFMKIDKSFVASVGQEERADAVVTAIVDLAHAHGMLVTAEGVETPRQARRLREIGCDFAQGFHFGRPGEAAKILRG